jgi:hypothetical protein
VASLREPTNRDTERLRDVSNREPLRRGPKSDMKRATLGGQYAGALPEGMVVPPSPHQPHTFPRAHALYYIARVMHTHLHPHLPRGWTTHLPSPPPPRLFVCAGVASIPYPPKPLEL